MTKAALIIGAGVATGAALARRFAAEGYVACVSRRKAEPLQDIVDEIEAAGGHARAFAADSTDEPAIKQMVETIEAEIGPIEVAIYNAAIGYRAPIAEADPEKVERVWRVNCFGAFLMARYVAPLMASRGKGTIIFTGNTAAMRGSALLAPFAMSKHGQRALAESCARELGPQGVHVAHVNIDGPIDTPLIRKTYPKVFAERPADGVLLPDDIAQTYWALHAQPRSAWTYHLELRPFMEPW